MARLACTVLCFCKVLLPNQSAADEKSQLTHKGSQSLHRLTFSNLLHSISPHLFPCTINLSCAWNLTSSSLITLSCGTFFLISVHLLAATSHLEMEISGALHLVDNGQL